MFILSYFRPSLAKAIIWPILITGLGLLSPPFWIELLNWVLDNQDAFPSLQAPISPAHGYWGWSLISLSFVIYCIETIFQYKKSVLESSKLTDEQVEDLSEETARKVAEKLNEAGYSAPHLQDEKIEHQLKEIKEFRFFTNYPKNDACRQLANSILTGELRGASAAVKAKALALLARYVVLEDFELGNYYFCESRKLKSTKEADIAEAFVAAAKGKDANAFAKLLTEPTQIHYSAVFMLKRTKHKEIEAINWLFGSGLSINSLDSDGQQSLLFSLLQSEQWEKALEQVDALNDLTQIESIGLSYAIAMTLLTNSISPTELRLLVIHDLPFAADKFPLADDEKSIGLRLKAISVFNHCAKLCSSSDIAKDQATLSKKYSLWLRLRTVETQVEAFNELRGYFSKITIDTLRFLPLAFSFGLKLDYEKVEKEVEQLSALFGELSPVTGLARFILAHKQKGYTQTLDYIRLHRNEIERGVHSSSVKMLEIEVLARCGLVNEAETLLASDDILADDVKVSLSNIVAEVKGADSIALAIEQYTTSKKVSDLAHLVKLLSESGPKDEFLLYAYELFQTTRAETDAINLANAYSINEKFIELSDFLESNLEIVDRSEALKLHKAWAFFREGNLKSAKSLSEELSNTANSTLDVETLKIYLSIYSGDWDALAVLVEVRWSKKDELTKAELLQTANIAKALLPNRAKELLAFVTDKFPDDPEVLASAYITATSLGWENEKSSSDWLNRAAMLSTEDDGPIHRTSFEEMKEIMDAKREQNEKLFEAYLDNRVPISLFAEIQNRSLSDFYLIQPLQNTKINLAHRKSAIAAFHSSRVEMVIESTSITVDVSSILIMGYLGLLDLFFKAFKKIEIPHSLMRWLYEEKQKVAFHQPSQIAKAKNFESLILDGYIHVTPLRMIEQPKLGLSIGDELAMLLETAQHSETAEHQSVVASSFPAYHVGSFRQEIIDLSAHSKNLISCSTLISKLRELSLITEDEFNNAIQYLEKQQHGEAWPEEPELSNSASVYLDSLSVTHLMALDVLNKFHGTNIQLFVHPNDNKRYKTLRNFDSTIQKADAILDKIRTMFNAGFESGQVTLSEMLTTSERKGYRIESIPLTELFHKRSISGGVLVDDRTINQNLNIQVLQQTEPVFTTLDLVETLHHKGIINTELKYQYKTKLREAGFGIISTTKEEIQFYLGKSPVKNGALLPCKELLLIKNHLSLLKISGLIKLPRDALWLHQTLKLLSDVLKSQWTKNVSLDERVARSNWLFGVIDFRAWAQCHEVRSEDGFGYFGEALRINLLMISTEIDDEIKSDYERWLNDHVLEPLQVRDPNSFNIVVASSKGLIKSTIKNVYDKLEDQSHG